MTGEQKTGQLKGPFKARENLVTIMEKNFDNITDSIIQIGIQAEPGTRFFLNEDEYEIGNTGLYEQMGTKIKSISFKKDTDEKTYIEYIMIAY